MIKKHLLFFSLVFVGGIVQFSLVLLLAIMFYSAMAEGGILIININGWGEMSIESFIVVPFVIMISCINMIYVLFKVGKKIRNRNKEMK